MTAIAGEAARVGRPQFHELTVARIDRLCEDAVAVTFEVPGELIDMYRFRPGQSLTLRRVVDGRDERRSYSICAPAGQPPRIGVREVPDGALSGWLVREVRPGDRIEVQPPSGSFTPDLGAPGAACADRGRVWHHAGAVHRGVGPCRSGVRGDSAVREQARRVGDVCR